MPGIGIPLPLIGIVAVTSAVLVAGVAGMAVKARRRPVVSGASTLLGTTGEVIEFGGGEGWASVNGESWRVRASEPLSPGQRVRVTGVHHLTLEVSAAADTTIAKSGASP